MQTGTPASCTYSTAPSAGDAIVVCAYRNGSNTAPTLPSGWARISTTAGANTNSLTIALKISDGTETGTGTGFTNANAIAASIYRNAHVAPIGQTAQTGNSTGTTANFPAVTITSGSWVIGCMGHKVAANLDAPAGMTLRARTTVAGSVTNIVIADTNGGVASWSQTGITVTSGAYRSEAIELYDQTGEDTTKLYADDYLHMNVADGNGSPITPTILGNGNDGNEDPVNCYDNGTLTNTGLSGLTVSAHFQAALGTIHVRSPSTDYATSSTTKSLTSSAGFHECRWENQNSALHRGAMTVAGWIVMPPDAGASGNIFDLWRQTTVDGNYCVLQLNDGNFNGNGTGFDLYAEVDADNNGTPEHPGTPIALTPSATYWVVFHCNWQKGEVKIAVYDTSGTQVGSTLTGTVYNRNTSGQFWDDFRIGDSEQGSTPHPNVKYEDIILDYKQAAFPLGPTVTGGGGGSTAHMKMLMGVGN